MPTFAQYVGSLTLEELSKITGIDIADMLAAVLPTQPSRPTMKRRRSRHAAPVAASRSPTCLESRSPTKAPITRRRTHAPRGRGDAVDESPIALQGGVVGQHAGGGNAPERLGSEPGPCAEETNNEERASPCVPPGDCSSPDTACIPSSNAGGGERAPGRRASDDEGGGPHGRTVLVEPAPAPAEEPSRRGQRTREGPRAASISTKRLSKDELRIGALLWPERPRKPATRADCTNVARPCPHVSCAHNLYLDVTEIGSIKLNFPDREPWNMPPDESCVLDVIAERGSLTLDEIAQLLNITRERVRQIIETAKEAVPAREGRRLRELIEHAAANEPPTWTEAFDLAVVAYVTR